MILVFALLGASFISVVYATTATFSHAKSTVGTVTNNECTAITRSPVTGYVWLSCGTSGATTYNIRVISGTSQIATTTVTVTAGVEDRARFFPINEDTVVFATGTSTSGAALFREYQVSGSTITNTRTFNAPCTVGLQSAFSHVGTSIFFPCTDGTVREFGLTSFTQLSSASSLTSGSPTCTTPRAVVMRSSSQGIAFCDNTVVFPFTISAGTITKHTAFVGFAWESGNFGSANLGMFGIYSNGYLYLTSTSTSNIPKAIALDSSTWLFSGSMINLPLGGGSDLAIANGGYWVITDLSNAQVAILDTNVAPPSNLLVANGLGTTVGEDSHLSTPDSLTFVMSKGSNGNTTIFYFTINNILINGSPPGGGGGTSPVGIDCTDPNYSYRLMCQVGSGNGALVGASQLLNQSSTNIICQIGLLPGTIVNNTCTLDNPDIKTNGVGYILFLVAMAIFVGIMWVASRGQLMALPTFIWFVGIVGIAGLFTVIQWLDPTILILTVVAVVAFAVAKVKGLIGGQQMFAGETN